MKVAWKSMLPLLAVSLAGCGSQAEPDRAGQEETAAPAGPVANDRLDTRLARIDAAVREWQTTTDLARARAAAEETRNLVSGPAGPLYGDGDGDGTVIGASRSGLLPGTTGELALVEGEDGRCLLDGIIGGGWSDPGARWARALIAIDGWAPREDTVSQLPGPAMRLAGWATLGLDAQSIDASRVFAQHAAREAAAIDRAAQGCSR